ncbi:hypothetical protein PVK06_007789 [Gossypium arboreum]|uniref:Uncharacterized protein n=1 Tax=Gossypium arboreum TaxID=29729 RepID=A0ABR0QJN4_GOSAR|nr:hypothetical protein PVK06_007789 [Gossypium arboreum]
MCVFMTTSDFAFASRGGSSFIGSRLVQYFLRYDAVKLDESNFVQWQQHPRLIIEGYELNGFIEGTLPALPQLVPSPEGPLVLNPEALAFLQQEKLLASWFLSTISGSLLSRFTDAKTTCDVWSTATRLFAVVASAKLSRLRHEPHSIKKGHMTIKEYVLKIQNTYALLDTSRSRISKVEKVEIILTRLSSEYDAMLTLASFSSKLLPLQKLVDVLLEYETRLTHVVQETPIHAHLVEAA